jgi:WD40 repeat protein
MRTLLALGAVCCFALPASAADPPAKVDRHGDPLPPGALMRLGTLRNRAPISSFGIEKDGTVVTVGPGADVRRWHPADDKSDDPIPLPLKGPATTNNYPQVSSDGKYVAACSAEKVFVWETPTAKDKVKEAAVFEIARPRLFRFSPDGTKLVVATEKFMNPVATIHLCNIKTGKVTDLEGGTADYFEGVRFSGDGKRVGAATLREFLLWDVTNGKQLAKTRTDSRLFSSFALNEAGDVLAAPVHVSGGKIELRFYDPLTGKRLAEMGGPEGASWVSYAPDGKSLLIGDRYSVRMWDPVANKLIRKFDGIASESYAIQRSTACFSRDGKMLVAHNGSALLRWEVANGKALFPEQDIGHGGYVNGVGVSPDGKLVATRGMDSRVCVWDVATGKELWHAPAYWTNSTHIDFSPDNKFLYVGGPEWGEATKYDTATGKSALKLTTDPKEPKQSSVESVRLSKDGKTVFGLSGPYSASDPCLVTEWDAATGERRKSTRLPFRATIGSELSPGAMFVALGDLGRSSVVALGAPEKNLLEDAKIPGFSFHPGCFSDDGKWLVRVNMERGGAGDNLVYSAVVISTVNWGVACTIPMAKNGKAGISADGKTLAVAVGEDLEFYDTVTAKRFGAHRMPAGDWEKAMFGYTHVLRFTPDGTKLITGHTDTTALVWPVPERPKK